MENKKKKNIFLIVEIVIGVLFIIGFIVSVILEKAAPKTGFSKWMVNRVWDVDKTVTSLRTHYPTIIQCLIYIILVFAICKIVRIILRKNMMKNNRTRTVITLIDGFVKYGCAVALLIFILKAIGVNTTALFASVGILTLVIGLGAQSLIADIIAGMFIIFENEYNVGEIITIDDFRGTVIEIGIRATKLLDMAGNIKIINNSNISNVVNMSRELSLAVVDCEFPYDVPIEFIEKILKDNLEDMKEHIPAIVEGPYYKGVSYYGESNVAIKLVAKCSEENRYQVQRDIMREYRQLIVAEGIDISYPQIVVNEPVKTEFKMTKREKNKVEEFVQEQHEASEGIEDQNND